MVQDGGMTDNFRMQLCLAASYATCQFVKLHCLRALGQPTEGGYGWLAMFPLGRCNNVAAMVIIGFASIAGAEYGQACEHVNLVVADDRIQMDATVLK
jgi:hypothetical protein